MDIQTRDTLTDTSDTLEDTRAAAPAVAPGPRRLGRRWIERWDPEDAAFWASSGRRVAWRNLWLSMLPEFLGFAIWQMWSIVAVFLPAAGFTYSTDQLFWLIAVPSLVGATLRFPYTFAVPRFGGRNWTIVSALLLVIPAVGLAVCVSNPQTPFGVMLAVAALGGVGGGNFASSMANISFFFPAKEKGFALGLNAAGGNLGVAIAQLAVPFVVVIGGVLSLGRAGLMWVPLCLVAAVLAWRHMDNLGTARADVRSSITAAKVGHTWVISAIYVGTFGSFIGYSAAFPLLLKTQFPAVTGISVAFAGPLVGSLARPLGGWLSDRVGGAKVTIASFVTMAVGASSAIAALHAASFPGFLVAFGVLFTASGIGNGSTYRMIPAVFEARARRQGTPEALVRGRREAAACIGIAAAVGAYGGFLVPRGFAVSMSHTGSLTAAFWLFIVVYAVLLVLTWFCYLRRGSTLAGAGI